MMSTSTNTAKKRDLFPLHVIITFVLMFAFGYLPAIGTITPIGMKLLGIFLGLLYGWTMTSLIWPSLLGIIAIGMSGLMPMTEFFKLSFANTTVIFILFIFILVGIMEEAGLVSYLASWFVSRKIIIGRPWVFTFMFLFGAFISGTLVNEIAATLIFWRIYYSIAKEFGFKPYDKYSTLMILGIAFCAVTAAGCTFPFKLGPLVWLATYTQVTGEAINFVQYLAFSLPMAVLSVIAYTLIMRFVFRPDISALKNLTIDFIDPKELILTKKHKIAFALLAALMILLLIPDFLPKNWWIVLTLKQLTHPGTCILLVVIMFFIKVDGKPMMDFPKMAHSISWDIYTLFAVILPLSTLLTSDATGIKPYLIGILSPMLSGKSFLIFALLVLLSGTIITNFANNAVLGVIYISMICPVAGMMGIDVFPIIAVMVFTIQLAYMTPAASAPSAMVFGNTQWVRAKDLYRYAAVILVIMFVVLFAIGMPFASLIF